VPLSRSKGVANFSDLQRVVKEFKLGPEAFVDTYGHANELLQKVKPIICQYAADHKGRFCKPWNQLGSETRGAMAQAVIQLAPWLTKFEESWALDFVFRKAINQRYHDGKRSKVREREAVMQALQTAEYSPAPLSHSKYDVIYVPRQEYLSNIRSAKYL
jgi:hypothetical protein